MSFSDWQAKKTKRVETWLESQLPEQLPSKKQTELWNAMRYALLGGGKRFRAMLVYASGELSNAPPNSLDYLAGAVEALHAYSLVHDDLPCMDNDDLRRGKPTCHKVYGDAMALLAGDALHALAFEWLLSKNHDLAPESVLVLAQHFANAIGHHGMVGGQAIDISTLLADSTIDVDQGLLYLQTMHGCKTGALIAVSLYLGYIAGLSTPAKKLPDWLLSYANDIGLLFQVVDDYLDATEGTATLGKTAGKDKRDGKLTYVSLLGLSQTQKKIENLLDDINLTLSKAQLNSISVERLMNIALWVTKRDC